MMENMSTKLYKEGIAVVNKVRSKLLHIISHTWNKLMSLTFPNKSGRWGKAYTINVMTL